MKPVLLLLAGSLLLTACAGNVRLIEDGKVHLGKYDTASRMVEVSVDGVRYSGPFVQNTGVGVTTAFIGGRLVTGTTITGDGSGQALLTSPDGKVIRCQFGSVVGFRGQGRCENNAGKTYDLLIGG